MPNQNENLFHTVHNFFLFKIGADMKDFRYINPLKQIMNPMLDVRMLPFLEGDHVTADVGTGLVHTAPAHGQEDFQKGLEYGLPVVFIFFFFYHFPIKRTDSTCI